MQPAAMSESSKAAAAVLLTATDTHSSRYTASGSISSAVAPSESTVVQAETVASLVLRGAVCHSSTVALMAGAAAAWGSVGRFAARVISTVAATTATKMHTKKIAPSL